MNQSFLVKIINDYYYPLGGLKLFKGETYEAKLGRNGTYLIRKGSEWFAIDADKAFVVK